MGIDFNYSEPLTLPTVTKWGDVSGLAGMPDNASNLGDVFEIVLGFQGSQNFPAVWLDLEGSGNPVNVPDFGTINLGDVFRGVQAFQGDPYPFTPPCGCSVPSPCP